MAIAFDYELISSLTLTLAKDEIKYIKVTGNSPSINWSLKIVDTGAKAIILTGLESDDFLAQRLTAYADLALEGIKISGTPTATEISTQQLNQTQASPNYIYIKNTSATALAIRFSIRAQK